MPPIIASRNLRNSWGPTLVLAHADFLLQAGGKVALVGPNGSGKSTLFRLLTGETKPDLGDLMLRPGLRFGYLPQVPNVPSETAARDILFAPSPEAVENGNINISSSSSVILGDGRDGDRPRPDSPGTTS